MCEREQNRIMYESIGISYNHMYWYVCINVVVEKRKRKIGCERERKRGYA